MMKSALVATSVLALAGCQPSDTDPAPTPEGVTGGPVERRAPFSDGEVFYIDSGSTGLADSPTLALVHGWASDHRVWRFQEQSLSKKVRLLSIDLPGHGQSDRPSEYTMDLFARSVAAVLDHAGIDRAVLVGHSNGTPVIRQFYRLFPERTAALVIVDGTLKRMFDQSMVDGMIAQLSEDKYQQFVGSMIDSMRTPGLADETTMEIRAMAIEVPHDAVVGNFLAGADPEIWTADPIDAPLLAVLARQPAWDDDYEAFVRGLAPQVDYHVLDDISHFLMMERPQDFDRLVIDFLENNALLSSTE